VLDRLAPESRLIAHRPFLLHLRDAGRARALDWLARHGSALGRRSTVDLETLFGSRAGAAEASAAPHAA
jgi:NTE family protein